MKFSSGSNPVVITHSPKATDCHHHTYHARYPLEVNASGAADTSSYKVLRFSATIVPSGIDADRSCFCLQ